MNTEKICQLARTVIETEAKVISNLLNRIDQNFINSCRYLYECTGHIIVIGMGKSGHIGKKIAATLASTGSPAFFIHPGEAKHGDIGMITAQNVVLMISYSGESHELLDLLPSIKRLGVPLIAMTGQSGSTLARAATTHLDISIEKEACPLGLAPTSSTTAALVMGDALAMVLSNERGFTKEDFALSHPGGMLGRRLLLRVSEIMHQNDAIPKVSHNDTLKQALVEITRKKLGITTIVNEQDELLGVFTDGDVRRTLDNQYDIQNTKMHQIMSARPKTISLHLLAADALTLMETHQITALVIVNDLKQPVGIVHIHDILRAHVVPC
ncbi:MAG: D-arabinose 5-phosphate isomerase [Gammaproteobacteria bacterium RIFCSPHIGHO2_12_FULL_42_10]|nr:MAG: D-arabinose 5-phosphate isomerase [Gammaproteobacteria bacterium RIFCSPHIGHO2_12_FULL_42_10]